MSLFSSFDKICDTACYLSHQHMSAVSSGFLDWVGRTLLLLHNFIIISFILLASMSQSKLFRRFSDNHIPFNFVWQWRICYCSFVYFQATLNTRRAHILGHNYRRRLKPECMYVCTLPIQSTTKLITAWSRVRNESMILLGGLFDHLIHILNDATPWSEFKKRDPNSG